MQTGTETISEENKDGGRKGKKRGGAGESALSEVDAAFDAEDLKEWLGKAKESANAALTTLREETKRRPELALGVALGVGFVLGGGLSTRFGRLILLGGVELALKQSQAGRSLFG